MSLILSIDQSMSCSGWALIEDGSVLKYGKVPTVYDPKDPANVERLRYIYCQFRTIIEDCLLSKEEAPDLMVLEKFFARNYNGANAVAEVRGVLKLAAAMNGIRFVEYPPQSVRKVMLGNGRAEKEEGAEYVSKVIGEATFQKKDYDITDAILMGLYAERMEHETTNRVQKTTEGELVGKKTRARRCGTKGDDHGK